MPSRGNTLRFSEIKSEPDFLRLIEAWQELARRRERWTPPPLKATRGTLYKYIKAVKSASEGCVTDE